MQLRADDVGEGLSRAVGRLGHNVLHGVREVGRRVLFLLEAAFALFERPLRLRLFVRQLHTIGNRSTWLILLTSAFTGMVLALQGYNVLVRFGSEELVGSLVALSLIRELGPVLAALMLTARAGSAMAATLGNMQLTEQIDAMRVMAVNPIQYLVTPRLVASLIAGPLLTCAFILSGIFTAYVFGVTVLGLEGSTFISNVRSSVEWSDVRSGMVKALAFSTMMEDINRFRGDEQVLVREMHKESDAYRVDTVIITHSREEVPISYFLHDEDGGFQVHDFSIEGVSLVNHHRQSFNRFLVNESLDALIERLARKAPKPR